MLASDELGNFVALSSNGQLMWELPLATNPFPVPHPPIILDNGSIIVQQRTVLIRLEPIPEPSSAMLIAGGIGWVLVFQRVSPFLGVFRDCARTTGPRWGRSWGGYVFWRDVTSNPSGGMIHVISPYPEKFIRDPLKFNDLQYNLPIDCLG